MQPCVVFDVYTWRIGVDRVVTVFLGGAGMCGRGRAVRCAAVANLWLRRLVALRCLQMEFVDIKRGIRGLISTKPIMRVQEDEHGRHWA